VKEMQMAQIIMFPGDDPLSEPPEEEARIIMFPGVSIPEPPKDEPQRSDREDFEDFVETLEGQGFSELNFYKGLMFLAFWKKGIRSMADLAKLPPEKITFPGNRKERHAAILAVLESNGFAVPEGTQIQAKAN
jgi:hypothetical protein